VEFRDMDFDGKDITLGANTFTGCTFRNCRVVFDGTPGLKLRANKFKENIQWVFDNHAANTILFLTMMYESEGGGGRELVEGTFENIRRGRKNPESPRG
jgi:hypothetical protein